MKNNIIMWTETDAFERAKLIDALKTATAPVREAIKHFEWEGEHLTCGPETLAKGKEHWRNLYFYLSGYGDAQFQDCIKAGPMSNVKKQPVAIPSAPYACAVCGAAVPPAKAVYRVNEAGQMPPEWRCEKHITVEQAAALGADFMGLVSLISKP